VAFTQNELDRMRERAACCVEECPKCEMVDYRAVRAIEPQLSQGIVGGLWLPDALHLDLPRVCAGLTEHLTRRGVEIRPEYAAIGARYDRADLAGVLTDRGCARAERYVTCVARPGREISGFGLPFTMPTTGGLAITGRPAGPKLHTCVVHEIGLAQTASGGLVATGPVHPRQPDNLPDVDSALTQVTRLLPRADNLQLLKAWTRLEAHTEDHLPVIGRASGRENVYVAIGSSGNRYLMAPIIGKLLAELITTGEARGDLEALSPTRLLGADPS